MRIQVIEYQLVKRRCGCGATTCATAPEEVAARVQYGPRITAIVLYLYVGQFLSEQRAAQALSELFGTPVSEGGVSAMTQRAAEDLDEFIEVVGNRIAEVQVAGFDEPGFGWPAVCTGCTAPVPASAPLIHLPRQAWQARHR